MILVVALILVARLYYVQIYQHQGYYDRATDQYVKTTPDVFSRGSIYYTTKDGTKVAAAATRSGYIVALNPSRIVNADEVCTALAPRVEVSYERCLELATLPDRTYVELIRTLPKESVDGVEELKLTGVTLHPNEWRYYPGESLTAQSLGFIGYTEKSETELRGKYGLERYYDHVLYRPQERQTINIFAEIFSGLTSLSYDKSDYEEGDIVTTIEPTVARMVDTVLTETHEKYQSAFTGAIVMDPMTGAIITMNAVPNFNLNDRGTTSIELFQNPLVENVYEFGSTIKALTVAAGLDSGAITSESTYYDAGSITLDGFTIRNYDGKGRGTVPVQEILSQSLNTGVAHIVDEMGRQKFREYFVNFRLGSESGIDLPYEIFGLINNLDAPRAVEYATASFGQGIALTPIGATRALAVLANGGTLVTPHLVQEIIRTDGTVKTLRYPEGARVIKPETSEEISRMLTVVVDTALGKGRFALPHHTIGAKTGTAQIPDPINGGYYEDTFLHSFFGYFPSFEPRFLVFMYTVEPKGVQYASETLAEPFMDIAQFLINYYDIPPDR